MVGLLAARIAAAAAIEAGAVLKAGTDVYLGGGAEYIKDGRPYGVIPLLGRELARQACRRYAENPGGMSEGKAENYEKACRPYLDDAGYGDAPSIELPFRGGQCPDTRYLFTWDRFQNGQYLNSGSFDAVGPLNVVKTGDTAGGGAACPPGQSFSIISMTNRDAPVTLISGCDVSIQNLQVSPLFGGRDTCGNPPPDVVQPRPPISFDPTVVPIIIAPDIDIDGRVTINIDGSIDIDIGTGPIKIDPFGDEDGGEPGVPGSGGGGPGAPEGGPVLPGGNGGFGGDDELGAPPAGKRWVGVCMAITAKPEGFGVVESNTVDKVYPEVVGNVRLICNATGLEVVNTPVQIRSDRVCLWEPVRGLNPVAIRVNLKPGFGYAYQGYAQPIDN